MKLKNGLTKVLEGVLAHDGVQPGYVAEKVRERIQLQEPIDFLVKEIGFAEILGAKALRVRSFAYSGASWAPIPFDRGQ